MRHDIVVAVDEDAIEVRLDEVAQLEPELEAEGAAERASNAKNGLPLDLRWCTAHERTRSDGKVSE